MVHSRAFANVRARSLAWLIAIAKIKSKKNFLFTKNKVWYILRVIFFLERGQALSDKIIFENENFAVVCKPRGVPSQEDKTGDISLLEYMKKFYYTENVDLKIINRLDRPVGGLIVFSKNEKWNKILSELIRNNKIEKKYLAIVNGMGKKEDFLEDWLLKNERLNISKVVNKSTKKAKSARLSYENVGACITKDYGVLSLLKVNLDTGRHHQIRVQLKNQNLAIFGDRKYNDNKSLNKKCEYISLWSYSFCFKNPETNEKYEFECYPKDVFPFNLFSLNGMSESFEKKENDLVI